MPEDLLRGVGDMLLLDSLPYVDDPIGSESEREVIQKMIEDEMKCFSSDRDYLAHLPPIPLLNFPVCFCFAFLFF